MESPLAAALKLKHPPVAILWSDEKPAGAQQFQPGKWGCVMAAFGATVERGRVMAFDRQTYGCWGGGVGLGFGNAYETFPGGVECFCRFLSSGNVQDPKGKAVADACKSWMHGSFLEDFLHGEGYRKTPERVDSFIKNMPLTDVPTKYVLFKRLADLSADEKPIVVVLLANPDQLSALIVLANYDREDGENAIIPYAAGCQTIGIYGYREAASEKPRAVVGLNDLSARKYLRKLGKDLMTFAVPYAMFQEMEGNVEGSFLEKEVWKQLQEE